MKPENKVRSTEYSTISASTKRNNEDNDCSVKALALLTGLEYEQALTVLTMVGREPKKGVSTIQIIEALESCDLVLENVSSHHFINRYPTAHRNALKSVTTHHPERFNKVWKDGNNYLVFTKDHVLAVKDGLNCDHTAGKALRVLSIYKVTQG